MNTKLDIAKNWLPRYTGTQIDEFGDYLLITNFNNYVTKIKFNSIKFIILINKHTAKFIGDTNVNCTAEYDTM